MSNCTYSSSNLFLTVLEVKYRDLAVQEVWKACGFKEGEVGPQIGRKSCRSSGAENQLSEAIDSPAFTIEDTIEVVPLSAGLMWPIEWHIEQGKVYLESLMARTRN